MVTMATSASGVGPQGPGVIDDQRYRQQHQPPNSSEPAATTIGS